MGLSPALTATASSVLRTVGFTPLIAAEIRSPLSGRGCDRSNSAVVFSSIVSPLTSFRSGAGFATNCRSFPGRNM